jgi:hypothetical protein
MDILFFSSSFSLWWGTKLKFALPVASRSEIIESRAGTKTAAASLP